MRMRSTIGVAFVALAVAGGSLAPGLPAAADSVTITATLPAGIAFGYSDGYWDQSHHWHAWRNRQEAEAFREHDRAHYYAWKHDRDPDKGWHDHDMWWHRH
jgi:hypothetical protein